MAMDGLRRVSSEPVIRAPKEDPSIRRTESQVTVGSPRKSLQVKSLGEGDELKQAKSTDAQKETSMSQVIDQRREERNQITVETQDKAMDKLPAEVVKTEVVNPSKDKSPDTIIGDEAGEAEKAHAGKENILKSLENSPKAGTPQKMNSFINAIEALKSLYPEQSARGKQVLDAIGDSIDLNSKQPPDVSAIKSKMKELEGMLAELKLAAKNDKTPDSEIYPAMRNAMIKELESQIKTSLINSDPVKRSTKTEIEKITTITTQQELKEALGKLDKLLEKSDTQIDKSMVVEAKKDLVNKYLPKLDLTTASENDVKSFVTNFKEITKGDSRFSKTHAVEKLLDALVKTCDDFSPLAELDAEGKKDYASEQKFALNKLEAELGKFVAKTPESTKMEWMKLLKDSVGEMKNIITRTPDEQKQAEAFNKEAVETFGKIQLNSPKDFKKLESVGKDNPMGAFGWAVLTGKKEDVVKQIQHALNESSLNSSVATLDTAEKVYESVKKGYVVQVDPALEVVGLFKEIERPFMDNISLNGKEYSFDRKLGAGSFGAAFKFTHTDENGTETSVVLKMFNTVSNGKPDDYNMRAALTELNAHRHITLSPDSSGKENTLNMLGGLQDSQGYMYSVMELADGGQMSDIMEGMNTLGKENILSVRDEALMQQYLSKGSIDGMVYIHDVADSAHLDIKPDNIFYDKTTGTVKVADYGTAQTGEDAKIEAIGTPVYMAPETMQSKLVPDGMNMKDVAKSSDKFSLGQTLSQLVTGRIIAFDENNMVEVKEKFATDGSKGSIVDGKILNPVAADEYKKLKLDIQALETKIKGNLPLQERRDADKELRALNAKLEPKRKEAYEQIEMPTEIGKVLSQTITGKVEDRSKALSEIRKNPFFTDLDSGRYSDQGIKARRLIGETIEFGPLQKKLDRLTAEKEQIEGLLKFSQTEDMPRFRRELTAFEEKKAVLEKQLKSQDQSPAVPKSTTDLTKEIGDLDKKIKEKSQIIEEKTLKNEAMSEELLQLAPQVRDAQTKVDEKKAEMRTLSSRIDTELNEIYKLQQSLGKFGESEMAKGKTIDQIKAMPEYKRMEKLIEDKIDDMGNFSKPVGGSSSPVVSTAPPKVDDSAPKAPKGLLEEIRQKGRK